MCESIFRTYSCKWILGAKGMCIYKFNKNSFWLGSLEGDPETRTQIQIVYVGGKRKPNRGVGKWDREGKEPVMGVSTRHSLLWIFGAQSFRNPWKLQEPVFTQVSELPYSEGEGAGLLVHCLLSCQVSHCLGAIVWSWEQQHLRPWVRVIMGLSADNLKRVAKLTKSHSKCIIMMCWKFSITLGIKYSSP